MDNNEEIISLFQTRAKGTTDSQIYKKILLVYLLSQCKNKVLNKMFKCYVLGAVPQSNQVPVFSKCIETYC